MILFHTPTVVCAVCNCCVFFRIKACACICCYVESTSVSHLTSVTMIVSRRQEWERRNPRTMIQEVQIGDLIWSTVHVSKSSHTTEGCHVAYRFIIQSWFSYLYIYIYLHIHLYMYIIYVSSNHSSRHWKILLTNFRCIFAHQMATNLNSKHFTDFAASTRYNLVDAATSFDRRICVKRSWRCVWKVPVSVMGDQLDLHGFSWSWKHGRQKHRLAEARCFV